MVEIAIYSTQKPRCRTDSSQCDEQKPSCGTCIRLGRKCESVRPNFKFCVVSEPGPKNASASASPESLTDAEQEGNELISVTHQKPSPGNIDIIKSLQHTERDIFYWTYWEDKCLPALHPMFRSALIMGQKSPIITDAILALSSCNISRLYAEKRGLTSWHMGSLSPNLVHQTRSQLYYSSAISKFMSLTQSDYQVNPTMIFTVLVLFAYMESSMGNFQGFNCHVEGLMNFLGELHGALGESMLRSLLTAWMQIRFVVWWARLYFSELEVNRTLPSVSIPKAVENSCETIEERRVVVLSIMCESHRVNNQALLQYWSQNQQESIECKGFCLQLAQQAEKLEEWLSHLPQNEMPSDLSLDSDLPIVFQSHYAALNFAYYVLARIVQCKEPLQHLEKGSKAQKSDFRPVDYWAHIMFRIALGVDMKMSTFHNSYTIGFSSLMLASVLRCQDISLGTKIEHWLRDLHSLQPTEEGAFPTYQTLGVARAVNLQRRMGFEVYAVSQVQDDAGGFPKFTVYNSQSINTLLLHGRNKVTGELFTEHVSIEL